MLLRTPSALLWLPLMGTLVAASNDVVYVTDLAIYTLLAPCAQSALSYNIMSMTYEECPEAVTALQSCVCSKNNNFASLSADVSSSVSDNCGSTASSDQASASTVFSAYCNQNAVATFPTPTVPVSQYITDIPEISYLAPCAASQVSYAVMSMTYELCPPDASDLATCVCQKNQNSLMVSQTINAQVGEACSSHTVDISSAQAFFSDFCNLNSGTSSFPSASNPPGDMTYYVTDMPQYSSLARCAKNAVSEAVFTNTYDLCPGGPQQLASCACIKESMSSMVASYITSNIQWDCSSNDAADVSSALSVFGLYCSAARNEAVVTGVTASVSQTIPFGLPPATGGGSTATGTSGSGAGGKGGSGSSGSNGGSGSSSNSSETGSGSKTVGSTAVIAGAVVGVVAVLGVAGIITFFVLRHVRKHASRPPANDFQQLDNLSPPENFGGKSELAGTPITGPGPGAAADAAYGPGLGMKPPTSSPSSSFAAGKFNSNSQSPPVPSVSPVSVHQNYVAPPPGYPQHGAYPQPPLPPQAELQGQMYSPNGAYRTQNYSELQGQQGFNAASQRPQQAELYGQPIYGQAVQFASHQQQPIYQADSIPVQPPSQTTPGSGMSFHSGPVAQTYSELEDTNSHRQPHAI